MSQLFFNCIFKSEIFSPVLTLMFIFCSSQTKYSKHEQQFAGQIASIISGDNAIALEIQNTV